jgi:hypothetical protein
MKQRRLDRLKGVLGGGLISITLATLTTIMSNTAISPPAEAAKLCPASRITQMQSFPGAFNPSETMHDCERDLSTFTTDFVPTDINYVVEFITRRLDPAPKKWTDMMGAIYHLCTMMDVPLGGDACPDYAAVNSNPAAKNTIDQLAVKWEALIREYAKYDYIKFNVSFPNARNGLIGTTKEFGQEGNKYDMFRYDNENTGNVPALVIYELQYEDCTIDCPENVGKKKIKNFSQLSPSERKPVYVIKRGCGNPLGYFGGLPEVLPPCGDCDCIPHTGDPRCPDPPDDDSGSNSWESTAISQSSNLTFSTPWTGWVVQRQFESRSEGPDTDIESKITYARPTDKVQFQHITDKDAQGRRGHKSSPSIDSCTISPFTNIYTENPTGGGGADAYYLYGLNSSCVGNIQQIHTWYSNEETTSNTTNLRASDVGKEIIQELKLSDTWAKIIWHCHGCKAGCCGGTDALKRGGSSTTRAAIRIPYNYDTTPTAVFTNTDDKVVIGGQDVDAEASIEIKPIFNSKVGGGNDYATRSKHTSWNVVRFVIEPDNDVTSGGIKNGGTFTTKACSNYYNSAQSGIKRCEEIASGDRNGTGNNGFNVGTSPLGGEVEQVTNWSGGDFVVDDLPVGTKVCIAASVYPATSHDTNDDGMNIESGGNWNHGDPDCVVIAKKPTLQIWGNGLKTTGNVSTSISYKVPDGWCNKGTTRFGGACQNRIAFGSWAEDEATIVKRQLDCIV